MLCLGTTHVTNKCSEYLDISNALKITYSIKFVLVNCLSLILIVNIEFILYYVGAVF